MSNNLNPDKALIFRIVHRDNLPWIFDHGLHCRSSNQCDPNYVNIGNPELIDRRSRREVPVPPRGTLADYVPHYFTPYSPMLLNIKTGYSGITQRANDEIVILVSSLHRLRELGLPFVFTNRHAFLQTAEFFSDIADLAHVDWPLLHSRNFKRDPEDPDKFARYEAEALVHRHLPLNGLLGAACYNMEVKHSIEQMLEQRGLALNVRVLPGWYF